MTETLKSPVVPEPSEVLAAAIKSRRMIRDFKTDPVPLELVHELLDVARHAPSAGFAQGVEFVVLSGGEVERFWDTTLPPAKRPDFPWPGLLNAPVVVVPLADAGAYLRRYRESDKAHANLGDDQSQWPVPYWHIDCAFAVQNLLLLAQSHGLGALFFGLFENTQAVRDLLTLPPEVQPVGAVALGHPRSAEPSQSARRPRRPLSEVIHTGSYRSS